jgi:hypothetical protein
MECYGHLSGMYIMESPDFRWYCRSWNLLLALVGFFFLICIVGGGVQTGSTQHVGHLLAYCTCPGWLWGRRIWWMNGRGNRSTRRKPAPAPLCPPQIPLHQSRDWMRAAAVGSQWLTASAVARPFSRLTVKWLQSLTFKHQTFEMVAASAGWSLLKCPLLVRV